MTAIKVGWAREQYARDRYDVEVDLADLPDILIEHEVDPAYAGEIPFSRKLTILRLVAEVHATDVYLRREAAAAGWNGKTKPVPEAVLQVNAQLAGVKAQLEKVLAGYKPAKVPEPAGT